MDPLSISASIAALFQVTSTVIRYLSDVQDGPKELYRIRIEICSVLSLLTQLQVQLDQAQPDDPFTSTLRSLNVPHGPFAQFYSALESIASKLAPVQKRNKLGKALRWPFKKEEIRTILNTIERQKVLLTLARQNDHIALSRAIWGDVKNIHGEIRMASERLVDLQMSEKHKEVHQWLAAPDPSSNYSVAVERRCASTGDWFLESDVYQDWLSTPGALLWLYGIPGCGKTILSSTIIQRTISRYQAHADTAVLYFYFDFNDPAKRQPENLVRSLIDQLSSRCVQVPAGLESLYLSCANGKRQPQASELFKTLHEMMGGFTQTYVMLDALDECLERTKLLTQIEEIAGWKDVTVHILATSRREKEIEESIMPFSNDEQRVCIQSRLVDHDIRTYIRYRLRTDRDLKRWREKSEIQLEVEERLMDQANGMFRWVTCQLDSLRECLNPRGLRKALASLPKTLGETYIRILSNIDEEHRGYASKILHWLAYSARPLKLQEVTEVIAIDSQQSPRFDPENRLVEPRDILKICSSLVSLEEPVATDTRSKSNQVIVQLAHFSVKEFLISDRILQRNFECFSIRELSANVLIYNDCLAYLLEFDRVSSLTMQLLIDFPLARYAAENWTRHAYLVEKNGTNDTSLGMELFLSNGDGLLNWIRLYDPDHSWNESDLERQSSSVSHPLYYASQSGLTRSVQMLLDKGAEVNAQGGTYDNALHAASYGGHEMIVQMLLEKGAEVNAQGGLHGNALQAASLRGHKAVVQMLLEKDAEVNAQGGTSDNALQAASEGGHEMIVQMLLDKGAEVNAQGGFNGNALQAASERGHEIIVQMLLDKGAEVNAQGGSCGNALQAASGGGHKAVVQMLLEKGGIP